MASDGGKQPVAVRPIAPEPRKLFPRLRTFVWVALITLLVWVWADLERTEEADVVVTVKVLAPKGSNLRIVSPDPRSGQQIYFTAVGAQRSLEQFLQQARREPLVCEIPADPAWQPGVQEVDTGKALSNWSLLRTAGISVRSAAPPNLQVTVDRWVDVRAKVKFAYTGALAGEPQISPSEVTVRVPSSLRGRIGSEPVIETELQDLTAKPTGDNFTEKVPLAKGIAGVPVELGDTTQVEVRYDIQHRLSSKTIPVSAEMQIPPNWLENPVAGSYVLVRSPNSEWRRNLVIDGPREDIEHLAPENVRAFVDLHSEAPPQVESWLTSEVTVVLPPNLKLHDVTPWKVDYKFQRQPQGVAPTPPPIPN